MHVCILSYSFIDRHIYDLHGASVSNVGIYVNDFVVRLITRVTLLLKYYNVIEISEGVQEG